MENNFVPSHLELRVLPQGPLAVAEFSATTFLVVWPLQFQNQQQRASFV